MTSQNHHVEVILGETNITINYKSIIMNSKSLILLFSALLLCVFTSGAQIKVDQNNNVGVGNLTPSEKLDVDGNVKISGSILNANGNAGLSGEVLTSDGAGNFTWSPSSTFAWSYTGNTITNQEFLGTINQQDLVFKTNNETRLIIDDEGRILTRPFGTDHNFIVGQDAGNSNISSEFNTIIGYSAGLNLATGEYNTLLGREAGSGLVSGHYNNFIGYRAGQSKTQGNHNNYFGANAGRLSTNGSYNNYLGYQAGYNAGGSHNNFIGINAGHSNVSGDYNNLIGLYAGRLSTGGSNNFLGRYAGEHNQGDSNICFGSYSGQYNTGSNNTTIGALSGRLRVQGTKNVFIGYKAGSGDSSIDYSTSNNIVGIGTNAGNLYNGTGSNMLGYLAGFNGVGNNNNLIGVNAGNEIDGNTNNVIGYYAGYYSDGKFNNLIGYVAGRYNIGDYNIIHGYRSGENNTGSSNIMLGKSAGQYNSGSDGLMIGNLAGQNNEGNKNTFIGCNAGLTNTTGNNNTFIGSNSDATNSNQSNCMAIGYNAQVDESNKIRLGNTSITSIEAEVNISTTSDARFKSNVKEDVPGIAFIQKLRPVTYTMDTEKHAEHLLRNENPEKTKATLDELDFEQANAIRRTGFIAQEVEVACQDINYDFDGVHAPQASEETYSLAYSSFIVPLVKAVQEQQGLIQKQHEIIEEQQEKLLVFEERISKLEDCGCHELELSLEDLDFDQDSPNIKSLSTDTNLKIKLYPNPATNQFNIEIEANTQGVFDLGIYDHQGRVVLEDSMFLKQGKNIHSVQCSSWIPGMYFVNTGFHGITKSHKIIVE